MREKLLDDRTDHQLGTVLQQQLARRWGTRDRSWRRWLRGRAGWVAPVALTALLLASAGRAEAAKEYQICSKKSRLVVHLFKGGVGSALAHDHLIRAAHPEGTLRLSPQAPVRSSLRIRVNARRLKVDETWLRKEYDLDPIDAEDRKKIRDTMHSREQLHTKRYPKITFRSTSIKALGGERYRVRGQFTVRGVTRKVSLDVRAYLVKGVFKASGQLRFKQSHFGFEPYSSGLGTVKVKDKAVMDIYLEARKRSEGCGDR